MIEEVARLWPVVAVVVWMVTLRVPALGEAVFRWGWVPVAAGMAVQVARRHVPPGVLRRVGPLLAWWVWAAFTLLWSPDPAAGGWLLAGVGVWWLSLLWAATVGELSRRMLWWLAVVGVVVAGAATVAVPDPPRVAGLNPDRILAMTVVGLVVAGWSGTVRRWEAAALTAAGLAVTVGTGSRMASAALVVALVVSPALRLPRRGRILVAALVAAAVLLAAGTVAFQQRWFVSGEGTLAGLVTGETRLDTSGRAEVWPQIAAACADPWLGDGAGASSRYGSDVNVGFPEPHDEFLRVWCDTGVVGVALFAGFVVAVVAGSERSRRPVSAVALLALAMLALTDNPLTTLGVAVPLGVVLGGVGSVGTPLRRSVSG